MEEGKDHVALTAQRNATACDMLRIFRDCIGKWLKLDTS